MKRMLWDINEYDENGKLIVLCRMQRMIDDGLVSSGDDVLSVGGWGKIEHRLVQEGCNVTLINLDKDECNRVTERYSKDINVVWGDIRRSGIASESFDVVECSETLEHILEDRDTAIDEMFRVLRHGGRFVGTIPIPGRCHPVDDPTVKFILPDEMKSILSQYATDINIVPSGEFSDEPSSWYFSARKV